jgi:hypothetical protein
MLTDNSQTNDETESTLNIPQVTTSSESPLENTPVSTSLNNSSTFRPDINVNPPSRTSDDLTEEELEHYRTSDPGPDSSRQGPGPGLRPNTAQTAYQRKKRSGFFTNVFGLATSDDVVELFKSETALHHREDAIERQVAILTNISNVLIQSYKNLSEDIYATLKREKNLFKKLLRISH